MRWKLVLMCFLCLMISIIVFSGKIAGLWSPSVVQFPPSTLTRSDENSLESRPNQHYLPFVAQPTMPAQALDTSAYPIMPTVQPHIYTRAPVGVIGTITQIITPTVQHLASNQPTFNDTIFIDQMSGWIVTDSTLLATTDGGTTGLQSIHQWYHLPP